MFSFAIDDPTLSAAAVAVGTWQTNCDGPVPPAVARVALLRWMQQHIQEILDDPVYWLDAVGSGWDGILAETHRCSPRLIVTRRPWPFEDYEVILATGGTFVEVITTPRIAGLVRLLRETTRWRGIPVEMHYHPDADGLRLARRLR